MRRRLPPIRHGRCGLATAGAIGLLAAIVGVADARYGSFDPGFSVFGTVVPDVGATGPGGSRLEGVAVRPDGRAVAAGWADAVDGADQAVLVQRTITGTPDPGFGATGPGLTRVPTTGVTRLHAVALDGAGRPLVAAGTGAAGQAVEPALLRFTATGAQDGNFTVPGPGEAYAVAALPGGATLIAGGRVPAPGAPEQAFVARFTAAGTLDGGFGTGGVAPVSQTRAEALAVDAAGRIVVAGWTTITTGGTTFRRPLLARLTAAGAPDGSFGSGGIAGAVGPNPDGSLAGELRAVQVDGAGRIVAAGVSGRFALVTRHLTGGTPDPAYAGAGATFTAVDAAAALNGLALEGERALLGGTAGPAAGGGSLLLGATQPGGAADPAFGGADAGIAPPGWRYVTDGGTFTSAEALASGPNGTTYSAGTAQGNRGFIARTLPNAAPTPTLAAPSRTAPGAAVTLDAAASSDPEGEPLRFAFDLDGDGAFELDAGATPVATRSFAAAGSYTVGVRVTDPRGASAAVTRTITVDAPNPPEPVLGKRGVARALRGVVRVRLPGRRKFVRLDGLIAIPNGTEIDARRGRVLLTVVRNNRGKLDSAEFYAGRFVFRQAKGRRPVTSLKLTGGSFRSCRARAAAAVATAAIAADRGNKKKKKCAGCGATATAGSAPAGATAPRPCAGRSGSPRIAATARSCASRAAGCGSRASGCRAPPRTRAPASPAPAAAAEAARS